MKHDCLLIYFNNLIWTWRNQQVIILETEDYDKNEYESLEELFQILTFHEFTFLLISD